MDDVEGRIDTDIARNQDILKIVEDVFIDFGLSRNSVSQFAENTGFCILKTCI